MIRFLFLFNLAFLSIIDINCGRNSKKNTDKADKTNKVDKKKNKENKKHPKKLNISNKNKSSDNNSLSAIITANKSFLPIRYLLFFIGKSSKE